MFDLHKYNYYNYKYALIGLSLLVLSIIVISMKSEKQDFTPVSKAKELRNMSQNAISVGEKLTYSAKYGVFEAGQATVEIKNTSKSVWDRELIHAVGTGKTNSTLDMFFKVRDRYETYMDKKGVFPWFFIRRVNEGGYIINQDYTFHQKKNLVNTKRTGTKEKRNGTGEFKVPNNVQDVFSSFYYARTFDYSKAEKGDIYKVKCFLDEELYPIGIKYIGKDTVEVSAGT
ncbi:MAG: DUF3108 domain-containing protein, partial [Flavobacteriales bacterium]